jgi:hypothetical protein
MCRPRNEIDCTAPPERETPTRDNGVIAKKQNTRAMTATS